SVDGQHDLCGRGHCAKVRAKIRLRRAVRQVTNEQTYSQSTLLQMKSWSRGTADRQAEKKRWAAESFRRKPSLKSGIVASGYSSNGLEAHEATASRVPPCDRAGGLAPDGSRQRWRHLDCGLESLVDLHRVGRAGRTGRLLGGSRPCSRLHTGPSGGVG